MTGKFNILRTLLTVIAILLAVYFGFRMGTDSTSIDVKAPASKLEKLIKLIASRYVDSISMEHIIESSIPVIVGNLDPHSTYFVAEDLEKFEQSLQGSFEGVGITFNMHNDTLIVVSVIDGGPANRAGVETGDRIVKINDSTVAGKNLKSDSIIKMLRGESGSKVSVDVQRYGFDKEIPIIMTRAQIPETSTDVQYMINDSIGFIKLSTFSRNTYREFMMAADKLERQGMTKLIVDLRDNTGGYMDQVINIADEFFAEKVLIVYTEGYKASRKNFYSKGNGRLADIDVNILINETTASSSEILSGAIQDNDRGTIIGRRSFGKGLVQAPITFSDGSGLNLTIARYYTPTGRCIQKPYDKGLEKYNHELYDRVLNNELFVSDSIHFNDSLKYATPKGKTVYGGGGIMPDIFVALDTIGVSRNFFQNISQKNLVYGYVLNYTDKNRGILKNINTFQQLDEFLKTQNVFRNFLIYAASNGISIQNDEIPYVKAILEPQLKGLIGRSTPLDNEGYYPYYEKIDLTLQKAIECFATGKK